MSIEKNIGKNTIGDNNKMKVDLRTYNMSTHDLSTVVRNTQAPGTLVPNMCLLVQKGDIIDIDIESNVLTHPTVGPLFGSFKLEHHVYTAPMRLYNSWLHNNRTKIGLNMADIKLPQINVTLSTTDNPTQDNPWSQVNPSCLLAYLGIKGYGSINIPSGTKVIQKTGLKLLAYYDIFKNYYANTQEDKFYTIGGAEKPSITYEGTSIPPKGNNIALLNGSEIKVTNSTPIESIRFYGSENGRYRLWKPTDLGTITGKSIDIDKLLSGNEYILEGYYTTEAIGLNQWDLESIDELRDNILATKGNITFDVTGTNSIPLLQSFKARYNNGALKTTAPQYGLALKTYNSDLYQNWINTEWIIS